MDISHDEFDAKIERFNENLKNLFDESKRLEKEINGNSERLFYEV